MGKLYYFPTLISLFKAEVVVPCSLYPGYHSGIVLRLTILQYSNTLSLLSLASLLLIISLSIIVTKFITLCLQLCLKLQTLPTFGSFIVNSPLQFVLSVQENRV